MRNVTCFRFPADAVLSTVVILLLAHADITLAEGLSDEDSFSGIYQVRQASLNVTHCDKEGKPTDYASQFLRISPLAGQGYRVEVCNGEWLDELDCSGGYQSTRMTDALKSGWQGYRYTARPGMADDGTPLCRLYAARRKVVEIGPGVIRYERTDWSETLSDFAVECNRAMAQLYSDSQSLNCATHIVIRAERVAAQAP